MHCIIWIKILFFFFFFQAEDGIRDGRVTGVQTCALPTQGGAPLGDGISIWPTVPSPTALPQFAAQIGAQLRPAGRKPRSEERRVGEEGRSRGGAYQLKKKMEAMVRLGELKKVGTEVSVE